MREQDRRHFPRYQARTNINAALVRDDKEIESGTPLNFSRSGAYVISKTMAPGEYMARFDIGSTIAQKLRIEQRCEVLQARDRDGVGVAVKFVEVLSESDLSLLAALPTSVPPYDLAHDDYAMVNAELGVIRTCRGQIFLTTLVAIGTWLMGAIGLGLTNHLQYPLWIAIGASFPYIVLSISILCLIEKAVSINMRKGFLAALEDYLRNNLGPPNYAGWIHLSVNHDACKSRAAAGHCRTRDDAHVDARCFAAAAQPWRSWFRVSPHSIVGKFGTLAAFIIAPLYIASSVLLYWYFSSHLLRDQHSLTLGLAVLIVGIFVFLMYNIWAITRGANCIEAFYFRWKHALVQCGTIDGIRLAGHQARAIYPRAAAN